MRKQLKNRLYDFVYVYGVISKFGKMLFDGHKTIIYDDPETGLINPIRFNDKGPQEPIYFSTGATLIVDATIDGEKIGDGHMWLPEDLSKKNFSLGDKVKVCGNVERYKKKDGKIDYCINVKRTEHC